MIASRNSLARMTGFLTVIFTVGLSACAQASFTVTTSTMGVTYSGGSLTSSALTNGQVIAIDSGSFTVGPAGGTSYTDSAGSILYLVNDFRTAGTLAIPNQQIYMANTTANATDTGVFTFSTNILVSYNGAQGTFSEGVSSITVDLVNGNQNYLVTAGTLAPPTLTIGGAIFTSSNPQATSGGINSVNNGGISAVISTALVPEPASLAMLGMGTIGILGAMARGRRQAK